MSREPSGLLSRFKPSARGQSTREHQTIMTVVLLLIAFGAVMIFSATSARNLMSGGGVGPGMLLRTVFFGVIPGLIVMFLAQRITLDQLREWTPRLLLLSLVLLVGVLIPGLGNSVNGARRWIGFGPFTFQPSEVAKVALVLFAASQAIKHKRQLGTFDGLLKAGLAPTLVAVALIVLEPDLGTAIVCMASVVIVLLIAGMPVRLLLLVLGGGALLVLALAVIEPYRMARLTSFLDPWTNRNGSGFQSVQGQIAIGSGGLFGVGLGESVQKIFYLPEAHTDFILSVIGEELGFAGLAVLLALYGVLLKTGMRVAELARDPYAKLIAAGATSLIICQALLNIWVVLGIAPLTGVPLPFISYGPTSLVVTLAATGLLLNVANGGQLSLKALDGGDHRQEGADARNTRVDSDRRNRRSHRSGT